MSPSVQYGLGPMALQSVNREDLTPVNSSQPCVILTEVIQIAAARLGMQKKELAALFELSTPDFTAAFGNNPENEKRNRLMKVALPLNLARQMALQLCEATGMAVSGADIERHALADVLKACSEYVRVVSR
jgi:hypothetical protein